VLPFHFIGKEIERKAQEREDTSMFESPWNINRTKPPTLALAILAIYFERSISACASSCVSPEYTNLLDDEKTNRRLRRLDRRLLAVASHLDRIATAGKMRKDQPLNQREL